MSRITHKEIEDKRLITHPVQFRVYEYLKQYEYVWFCDIPAYSMGGSDGFQHYMMDSIKLLNVNTDERYGLIIDNIKYKLDELLYKCERNNNILMIYVSDSGLWMETNTTYNPNTFAPNIGIMLRCKMIPRVNGGIDVEQILSNKASEEMAKGINKEILNGLTNLGEKNNYMYLLIG